MSGLKVLYKNNQITASNTSVIKKLLTSGKYCEDNTTLVYDNPLAPNLIPESVEVSSTNIYNNGLGYKNGYYISSGSESANENDCLIGCIPYVINGVQPTDILYIKGYTGGASESHTRLCARKADKTRVTEFNGFLNSNNIFDVTVLDTGYYKLTPKSGIHHSYADIGYIQFSFHQPDASKIVITKNEEISYEELLEAVNVPFTFGDIPDYVKTEAMGVAEKVRAVQTTNTITSICWADAHHTKDQVTGWQAQTNISTLHAAMGISIIATSCPIDFCAYCGDYTFGNGDTTFELFEGQVKEMNRYMDVAFGGVPAMYCVGNHDTGEYLVREHSEESLFGAENVYRLIGSRNADGVTVMGSTRYGYCYRDIPSKKVRVINLNTVEGETETGYLGDQCSDTQLLWFAQALYSIGSNSDWGIIVVSHYPLDYGGTCHAGNIVYQYINGGSVTYNDTIVNFSGHNSAKFIAQYHGHTHCLKAAKLNYVSNSQGTEFDAYRVATPSGTFYRNNDYKDVVIYGISFGETETYPKTADSGKDTAFVVNVYDPDKEVIFSFCYGAGYDRSISIGPATIYSVTNNLSHVVSSNNSASAVEGDSYSAIISATTPWSVGAITVTMGGTDITSTAVIGSTISIAEVTGDIVITAKGVLGNLINYFGYTDGKRLSTSTGGYKDKTGGTVIEYINLSEFVENETVILHITGARFAHNSSSSDWDDNVYIFYKSDKSTASGGGYTIGTNTHGSITLSVTHTNYTDTVITITGLTQKLVTSTYQYIRLCGVGSGANVDIRVGSDENPVLRKQINFVDYDGTILHSYTSTEWANISALPSNPSHSGLTAQGWNWTKAQIDSQLTAFPDDDVWVGQMYITDDGKTRIYIRLEDGRLHPYLGICPNGTVVVDWGDSSATSTLTGTSLTAVKYADHVYASSGDYMITLTVSSGSFAFFGVSNTSHILNKDTSTTANIHKVYTNAVQRIELGQDAKIGNFAFNFCQSLASITISSEITSIGINAFQNCSSLTNIVIPSGVASIGNASFFNCNSLARVTMPSIVTSIGDNTFNGCQSLTSIMIPKEVTSIGTYAFYNCYSLAIVTIPSGVTAINNNAFNSCYGMAEYHIQPTTPPTLGTTAFSNIQSDCVIYVPSESLTAYQEATNWSTYASYMQGE